MFTRTRAWAIAALAVVALAGAAGSAQGRPEVLLEPAGAMSATSAGKLTFTSELGRVACDTTLTGTLLAEALELSAGTEYGTITGARFANCEGGAVTVLGTPWRLQLSATLGTFPEAFGGLQLQIVGAQIQLVAGGVFRCLYAGTLPLLAGLTVDPEDEEAWDVGAFALGANALGLVAGSPCGRALRVSGTLAFAPPQQVKRRTARLVHDLSMIPRELDETVLVLYNGAAAGAFEATVGTVTLTGTMAEGFRPELFSIPAETNDCPSYVLNPARTRACTADIRYTGGAGRPTTRTRVRIDWNDGVNARIKEVVLTAHG